MSNGPFGGKILSATETDSLYGNDVEYSDPRVALEDAPTSDFIDTSPHPLSQSPHVAFGGSIARLNNSEFSPYNYSLIRSLYQADESALYNDYDEAYRANPFAHMLVEYVVARLFADGYHFEGPGKTAVDRFFEKDNTNQKLELLYRDGIIFGNGFMDIFTRGKNGPLVETRIVPPSWVVVELIINQNDKLYGKRKYWQGIPQSPLDETHMYHFMPCEQNGRALGLSMLRANLSFLQSLQDAGGDTFAALKRVAFAPLIAKLDLDSYSTEADKMIVLNSWIDRMREIESSTNNFAIDKRNDINLVGVGSAGGRLLPVNDLIEPWVAICLRNFGFPIGLFLQSGANKSIVDAQREDVRAFFNMHRRKFSREIETHILPRITGREVHLVWNKPPPSSPETQEEMKTLALLYQLKVISKEYFQDQFDIEDEGTEFYEGNVQQGASHDLGGNPGNKTGQQNSGGE